MIKQEKYLTINQSKYEFSHWKKENLKSNIGVMRLICENQIENNPWNNISKYFFDKIWLQLINEYQIYLLLSSNIWKKDSKINRHKGILGEEIGKYFLLDNVENLLETCHECNGKIKFTGISRTFINERILSHLLESVNETSNGLIFCLENNVNSLTLNKIEKELFEKSIEKPDSLMEHMINIPKAINVITVNSGYTIFPHGSLDFGGFYLDLFGDKNKIDLL